MKIYLDYAATTPVRSEVISAMLPYFSNNFGNASSLHGFGRDAKIAVENSRATIARTINASPSEIIFTSGATEANNLAIKGIAKSAKKGHVIVSAIEHDSVLEPAKALEREGFSVSIVKPNKDGIIDAAAINTAIRKDTMLVCVMLANNEVGTVQPIWEIGELCKRNNILFHCDAVQAFGKIPIDVKKLSVDTISISGHKIYGPKGVGALYIRKGLKIEPLVEGGGHEFGLRSGTSNVAAIVGFAKAAELATAEMKNFSSRTGKLRERMEKGFEMLGGRINCKESERLPNITNVSFPWIDENQLVLNLDAHGVAISSGSACAEGSKSHVADALGIKNAIRFSLGRDTTETEIQNALKALAQVAKQQNAARVK